MFSCVTGRATSARGQSTDLSFFSDTSPSFGGNPLPWKPDHRIIRKQTNDQQKSRIGSVKIASFLFISLSKIVREIRNGSQWMSERRCRLGEK